MITLKDKTGFLYEKVVFYSGCPGFDWETGKKT